MSCAVVVKNSKSRSESKSVRRTLQRDVESVDVEKQHREQPLVPLLTATMKASQLKVRYVDLYVFARQCGVQERDLRRAIYGFVVLSSLVHRF